MSDFRKLAHLAEQLGEDRFSVLIDSANTGKVKEFCDSLVKSTLPTEIVVGGRTYEILTFLREGENLVSGYTMVERAVEMDANLGEDDGQHLLDNQRDIPAALRGKVSFVFTNWRHTDNSEGVYFVCWGDGRWIRLWYWLALDWDGHDRVLRRKK